MTKFAIALVFLVGCADNLPTNETSQPPVAGASAPALLLGTSAKIRTELVLSENLFGTRPFCENPSARQTSCYTHEPPWTDGAPWFYILWGQGGLTEITSQVYFPQDNAPAIYLGTIDCTQTSCTELQ